MSGTDILLLIMGVSFIAMIIYFQVKTKQLSKSNK